MPKTTVSARFLDRSCSQAQATHSPKNTIFFKKSRHSLRKLSAGWHSTDSYLPFVFIVFSLSPLFKVRNRKPHIRKKVRKKSMFFRRFLDQPDT